VGEETTRLREEIHRTRDDLTRDVDLLADKTSPSRIVERRVQRTRRGLRRGFTGLREKVMGSSPSSGRHRTAPGYGPTYTDDVYATGYGTEYGREYGSGYDSPSTSQTGSGASHIADSARETVSQAREQVLHAGERTQQAAQGDVSDVRRQTEGNPLAAGLVAFGVGWLVSSLMPVSEAEQQAASRAGELAREHGGPVVDQAKQAASEVGLNLQQEVQQAAQQVKERAQDATGAVTEEAKSAASSERA
jgi:hypothetical protein